MTEPLCHSGERPFLSGMVFECVLKVLYGEAVWVEFPHGDTAIQIATGTPHGM
jgi:hypothetical protein